MTLVHIYKTQYLYNSPSTFSFLLNGALQGILADVLDTFKAISLNTYYSGYTAFTQLLILYMSMPATDGTQCRDSFHSSLTQIWLTLKKFNWLSFIAV